MQVEQGFQNGAENRECAGKYTAGLCAELCNKSGANGARCVSGGRDRTRTCDLLRVKHENRFFSVLYFLLCPLFFNNLGHLLSLSRQPLKTQ